MKTIAAVLFGFILSVVQSLDKSACVSNNPSLVQDAVEVRILQLNMHPNIQFSWSAVRGTANITVYTSKDVTLNVKSTDEINFTTGKADSPGVTVVPSFVHVLLGLSVILFIIQDKVGIALVILLAAISTTIATDPSCDKISAVHVDVPLEYVKTICHNGTCFPVLCTFVSIMPVFSSIPSNNKLLFKDNLCNIKKPDRWDEWVQHYFGVNSSQDFYADYDGDGLINIMEYYGSKVFNDTRDNSTRKERSRRDVSINKLGTNPIKADSDGDLLMDGFETYNRLDPVVKNNANEDYDSDNLTNLKEQIWNTDPLNPDSDGDGVSDGVELQRSADPLDPTDKGRVSPLEQMAVLRLTIGDQSGSHSERYILHVGGISHQSPGYGLVGSGTYTFKPGTYKVTIQHTGSIYSTPDYDYTALISKVSGSAKVVINDAKGILGYHSESDYFYAQGKFAQVIVEDHCSASDNSEIRCQCAQLKSCSLCKANSKCAWDVGNKKCKDSTRWIVPWNLNSMKRNTKVTGNELCPCESCKLWYEGERKDKRWLTQLNNQFRCPCKVTLPSLASFNWIGVTPIDNPSGIVWETDTACLRSGMPLCGTYHPGAYGCLRSKGMTQSGAAQQCCYNKSGNIISPGKRGAGTPDKISSSSNNGGHRQMDVDPYTWCCTDCELDNYCNYYIGDVRKGDDSHCT